MVIIWMIQIRVSKELISHAVEVNNTPILVTPVLIYISPQPVEKSCTLEGKIFHTYCCSVTLRHSLQAKCLKVSYLLQKFV